MKHPHAENMLAYAEDALETEIPWSRWQIRVSNNWFNLNYHPEWHSLTEYRRKPEQKYLDIDSFNKWYERIDPKNAYLSDAWQAALKWERSRK